RGIGTLFATRYLTEQLDALERLAQTPTARLERVLAEHLDCCTYRLDAWMSGLINFQLQSMRHASGGKPGGEGESYRQRIFFGGLGLFGKVGLRKKSGNAGRIGGGG